MNNCSGCQCYVQKYGYFSCEKSLVNYKEKRDIKEIMIRRGIDIVCNKSSHKKPLIKEIQKDEFNKCVRDLSLLGYSNVTAHITCTRRQKKMNTYHRLINFFDANDSEYGEFQNVKNKRSNRPDLHAFLLLDELFPDKKNIISAAQHDEFWINISFKNITDISSEHLLELIRCGICFEGESFKINV